MKITRISPLTGEQATLELAVTAEQMKEMESWPRRSVQDIFPDLLPKDREFIKSGYTQEDWIKIFPPETPYTELVSAALDALEYFDDTADVDEGQPNKEMKLAMALKDALLRCGEDVAPTEWEKKL